MRYYSGEDIENVRIPSFAVFNRYESTFSGFYYIRGFGKEENADISKLCGESYFLNTCPVFPLQSQIGELLAPRISIIDQLRKES